MTEKPFPKDKHSPKGVNVAATLLMVFFTLGPAWASDKWMTPKGLWSSGPDELVDYNIKNFLYNFEGLCSDALKKSLKGENLMVAIFMTDYSGERLLHSPDPWLSEQVESQAKQVAREAFRGCFR